MSHNHARAIENVARRLFQPRSTLRRHAGVRIGLAGAVILGLFSPAVPAQDIEPQVPDPRSMDEVEVPEQIAPVEAPFRMPAFERPTFPDAVFDIRDYGAEPGRDTDDSDAIDKAIAACAEEGGGQVLIPAGDWRSGPIHLESHVNLHVAEGATVHFKQKMQAYLPPVLVREEGVLARNLSPLIYARNAENIAITGEGTFDGKWPFWKEWAEGRDGGDRVQASPKPLSERDYGLAGDAAGIRPNFVVLVNCRDILIEGPSFVDSPMWNLHPVFCENVIIRDVTIDNQSHNGDGIIPDSTKNVLIEYVTLRTGDDAVVMKSGLNEEGRLIDVPTRNVVVRNLTATDVITGSGGVVFGSETSGGIHDIYVNNAYFEGTDKGIRFKTAPKRGAYVAGIYIENVRMQNIRGPAINFNLHYSEGGSQSGRFAAPRLRDIQINDVHVSGAEQAFRGLGAADQWIRNVSLADAVFKNVEEGIKLERIDGLTLGNIAVSSEATPLHLKSVYNVRLDNLELEGEEPKLRIESGERVYRDGSRLPRN